MYRMQVETNTLQSLTNFILRLYLILTVVCLPSLRLIGCDTPSGESLQHHGSGHSNLCWQYVTPVQNAQ